MSETHNYSSHYRYWAFISYSNQDRRWAVWLHRAIETYGVPVQLKRHITPVGEPAPRRLQPLFRDRDELPASADLGAQIEEALRGSRFLIVVCSPTAARSRWVNKEIETFLKLHRADRILAIIVEGEPNAGGDRECLPPALRKLEPVAADARPQGDGKRLAKLKLLAGMLGVGFDSLRQRDAHRQVRRLQAIVAASMVLTVVFAGLAWYANSQRVRAVKARQQAENILQFLVYDMRDELTAVGRTDIVERVQKRVDEYYKQLGTVKSDTRTLHNRAAALTNQGDLAKARGNLREALEAYQAALDVADREVRANPGNVRWQYDLSVSHEKIGDVLLTEGNLPGALAAYVRSTDLLQRVLLDNPDDPRWQYGLAVGQGKVGDVLRAQGNTSGALEAYRSDVRITERLINSDTTRTEWMRGLSGSYQRIGITLAAQGDFPGALEAYQKARGTLERLTQRDLKNKAWQHDLSVSLVSVGRAFAGLGNHADALEAYQASLRVAERLVQSDPLNTGWMSSLSLSEEGVGDGLMATGQLAEAQEKYRSALSIQERLARGDPDNTEWQRALSITHKKVGDVLRAKGDLQGAIMAYQKTQDILERLAQSDPRNAGWQVDLSAIQTMIGDILTRQGKFSAALTAYRATQERMKRVVSSNPGNAVWQSLACRSLAHVALAEEKMSSPSARAHFEEACECFNRLVRSGAHMSKEDMQTYGLLKRMVGAH